MTIKIIKAQITTRDEKGHIRHYSERDTEHIDWGKVAEAIGAPKTPTKEKKSPTAAAKKKD